MKNNLNSAKKNCHAPLNTLNILITLITLIFLVTLQGCGSDDLGPVIFSRKTKPAPIKKSTDQLQIASDPYYDFLQKALFEAKCVRCHNATSAKDPKEPRLDLTLRDNIIREYQDILDRMTVNFDYGFGYMPPKGEQVKPEIIKIFEKWKENGFQSKN